MMRCPQEMTDGEFGGSDHTWLFIRYVFMIYFVVIHVSYHQKYPDIQPKQDIII